MNAIAQITEATPSKAEALLDKWMVGFMESQVKFWDTYVDPRDAYYGPDGELWDAIGTGKGILDEEPPYRTDAELRAMRSLGRLLWQENEFAINGHENRVSYIIGWGHTYTATGVHADVPEAVIAKVQGIIDQWKKVNKWMKRQQEMLMRYDRDGEVFVRKFPQEDGYIRLRFVEPGAVLTPGISDQHFDDSFGIRTPKDDIETVVGYFVNGERVEASKIQHRKANVDSGLKRGVPLFWPVRRNLARASKILRNMSTTTEIQTAIALIRKHTQATGQAVRSFVAAKAVGTTTDQGGRSTNVLGYGPGSIIDANAGTEYTFPTNQLDPSKTVQALAAELRSIASRLVMPEFMLTSDASNANFSSTMVAEGPAVKYFERAQQSIIDADMELIDDQLDHAVAVGMLTPQERALVKVSASPPSCKVRDELKEAQTRQIDMGLRILSPQTACAETGRDYAEEQTNIEAHEERSGSMVSGIGGGLPELPSGGLPDPAGDPAAIIGAPSSMQATALNGAQIASLSAVAMQVAGGQLKPEAGKILLRNAFPMIPEAEIDKLIQSMA